jgi:hypothetical protein
MATPLLLFALLAADPAADRAAITQLCGEFAEVARARDVPGMNKRLHLVCELQTKGYAEGKGSDAAFALAFCRYVVAYQDCAEALAGKFGGYRLVNPAVKVAMPTRAELRAWAAAVASGEEVPGGSVGGERCRLYRVNFGGQVLTQRFVFSGGRWHFGSPPFTETWHWEGTRNHPSLYAISFSFLGEAVTGWDRARALAEGGEPKEKVQAFLRTRLLLIAGPGQASSTEELAIPNVVHPKR